MKYQIIGKNITVTEGISSAVTKKLARMERYFKDENIDCRVVVASHGETAKIEITIFLNTFPLRAEVEHKDLYAALDLAIDKLEGQMRKVKTRMDRSNGKTSLGEAFFMDVNPEEKEEPDETPASGVLFFLAFLWNGWRKIHSGRLAGSFSYAAATFG